jgi:hypothetical protein
MGAAFIDEQLLALYTHASLLADWIENGGPAPDLSAAERLIENRHAHPESQAESSGGAPLKRPTPEPLPPCPSVDDAPGRMSVALRVPCLNAIVAVAAFFDTHRLSSSRTPEVQFLMRLRDAALTADTFRFTPGECRPQAAYGGLVIDERVDGRALFGNGVEPGLVTFGDVIGLLAFLRSLLRSMRSLISSGDAG